MAPLFSGPVAYDPLLFLLQARLHTFRAMNASFTPDLLTVWNLIYRLPLLSSPHLVTGPVACLAHTLLSLGFTLGPDLCAGGVHSNLLHLLHSPLSHWRHEAEVTWLRQVVSKEPRTVWQGSQPCFLLWKSMCAAHQELPPLSLSFRVGKILSASALATFRGLSHFDCEFCGSTESDTRHLVDHCPAFSHTRDNHGYTDFRDAPLLTRCTGIPSLPVPPTLDAPEEGPGPTNVTKDSVFFTDGSAVSPDLPAIRAASWSIVVAHPDGSFPLVRRGLLPGRIQTIGRAELFAFLVLPRTGGQGTVFIDCQYILDGVHKLCTRLFHELDWLSQPDADLWKEVMSWLVAKGPLCLHPCKVKAHQTPSTASSTYECFLIQGNAAADHAPKSYLKKAVSQSRPALEAQVRSSLRQAWSATCFLHHLSEAVFRARKLQEQTTHEDTSKDWSMNDLPAHSTFDLPTPLPAFPAWDPKWTGLCLAYFAELRWRHDPSNPHSRTSLLELMLDLMVTFQTYLPLNLKQYKGRFEGAPTLRWNAKAEYWLPSPTEQAKLPKRLLSDWSHTFLTLLDLASKHLSLVNGSQFKAESLSRYGYNNTLPSVQGRPVLLSPEPVDILLSKLIVPRSRSIHVPLSLPQGPRRACKHFPGHPS